MLGMRNKEVDRMNGDRCEFCEGEMEQKRVLARFRFMGQTIYVENAPAWVCNRCGEQYYDAPVYKQLEEIAQQRERIHRVITFPLAEFDTVGVGLRESSPSYDPEGDENK